MTTTTPVLASLARPDTTRPLVPDVVRSEWTKLRSVRSTYWTLLAAAAAMVGLAGLLSAVYVNRYDTLSAAEKARFHPVVFSLNGLFLAQLAIGVLGVLVITAEYTTGSIRSTLAAVPQRATVLAAKAAVFSAVTATVGIAASFGAFFVGQAILSGKGIGANIGDPGALRAVVGAGLYLAVLGLLALGLGTLIRRTAGAIAAVFGLIFVLPGIVAALPSSWNTAISPYLPSNAGQAILGAGRGGAAALSPWVGFGVFCAYAAAALVASVIMLARRDA
ncbi:MAG: type transport system permease protein [Actinomycetota bacterium]|nr:type transport system permease protein [Actinomycetota bacterium]